MGRNSASLRNDPGDIFKTPTICDTTAKNPPGSPPVRRTRPNQGDSLPPNFGSISATTSHGASASLRATEDGRGREVRGEHFPPLPWLICIRKQDKEPDLEATVVWSGDARATIELEDSASVKRWKEEIDMLLAFVSRFRRYINSTLVLTWRTNLFLDWPLLGRRDQVPHGINEVAPT